MLDVPCIGDRSGQTAPLLLSTECPDLDRYQLFGSGIFEGDETIVELLTWHRPKELLQLHRCLDRRRRHK